MRGRERREVSFCVIVVFDEDNEKTPRPQCRLAILNKGRMAKVR
jgi:hypothetical protein